MFTASFRTLTFLPRLHTAEDDRAFIEEVVLRKQEVLVADLGAVVVGFVAMKDGMIEHLYVEPERRRQGIGTALLDAARDRMPNGFRLWVFQQNEPARRFYERHGLSVVELTDGRGNEERTPDALYEWRPRDGD